MRTARREDEEPEPGEGWEGGARPEEYVGLFDGPKGPLSAVPFVVLVRASLL